MACYGRRGGGRAGKELRGGVGCRDVSLVHWGNEGRNGRPRTLTSEHRKDTPPVYPHLSKQPRENRKFTQPCNPLYACPPKGELGLKEDLTLVWGQARRKMQRCLIFYLSQAARGEGTVSGEMAREMGLCHDTSGSWRVGDTMSSFSPTPGPGPSRPSPAGPTTVDRLGPRAWLALAPGGSGRASPSPGPSRRPGPRAAAPDTEGTRRRKGEPGDRPATGAASDRARPTRAPCSLWGRLRLPAPHSPPRSGASSTSSSSSSLLSAVAPAPALRGDGGGGGLESGGGGASRTRTHAARRPRPLVPPRPSESVSARFRPRLPRGFPEPA